MQHEEEVVSDEEARELDSYVESLRHPKRFFPVFLALASLAGLFASSMLVWEKISYWTQKAEGTSPVLACDVNPIVGCGQVLNSEPASIFGSLPNPLIGVVAFSALLALAVVLTSRVTLPRWIWTSMQLGVLFGLGVVTYLQYQSIYVLGALCPYCMVVWSVMIPIFWSLTSQYLSHWRPLNPISSFLRGFLPGIIVLHFIVLGTLIWLQFGSAIYS